MAETAGFFGFDATLSDQVPSWEEDGRKENEINARNEETFGSGAQQGDWETDHKKVKIIFFGLQKLSGLQNLVVQQMQRVNLFPLAMNRWKIVIMLRAKICYVCI